jgi:flagellar FliJ protein
MKFKFGFETLLEHQRGLELIARRDFNDSMNHLDNEKALYKKLYTRLHEVEAEGFVLRGSSDGIPVNYLIKLDEFAEGQKIKIARQREVVINHTQIMEAKQEILIAAAKETKILEKLKEKKLEEFKKLVKKRDAKINDELVVTRFNRRAR